MIMQGLHYDLDSLFPENPDFLNREEICLKDYDNICRLYPNDIHDLAVLLNDFFDSYEYEGSMIFHEYPDKETIYWIVDRIYNMIEHERYEDNTILLKDIIQIMICDEIYIRRRRHNEFCENYRHEPDIDYI